MFLHLTKITSNLKFLFHFNKPAVYITFVLSQYMYIFIVLFYYKCSSFAQHFLCNYANVDFKKGLFYKSKKNENENGLIAKMV